MIPVDQTRFGDDPTAPGNCFGACVASIFECDMASLPDEVDVVSDLRAEYGCEWDAWSDRLKRGRSWELLWSRFQEVLLNTRGVLMVRVVHDPHPSRAGIAEEGRTYIYFVVVDPSLARRTTRNFCDVIRAKLAADPELARAVEEARIESLNEQKEYDELVSRTE